MSKKPSVFSEEKACWLCGSPYVHKHHVCGGVGRRPISEQEGLWVYLCGPHHNQSNFGVHFDKNLDTALKEQAQMKWEQREGLSGEEAHKAFRDRFGISYL